MKNKITLSLLAITSLLLTSCQAVEVVFKAGMWWAFFLVALIVIIVIWVIRKFKSK